MVIWCKHCQESQNTVRDEKGYICCNGCGRVIDQDVYTTEVTFIKTAGGAQLAGNFVRSVLSDYSASHERTVAKGRDEIADMVSSLRVSGGEGIIDHAHAFYKIAVERNFTRGRRTVLVSASCLYIACRQLSKAYLLIDFSEYLQINVYVLGAVFLQLCQLLRLQEHPIVQKPIDPSLFIHRFADNLLGEKNPAVSTTALQIVASMKRDWMQTGRKPSGLCGAALYISALSHGIKCSKSDVVKVVHVCEGTLTKRLIEFENTEPGSLTIDEFVSKAKELEREKLKQQATFGTKTCGITEVLCEHKDEGVPHFAHGLCKLCYDDFMNISGGLQGGSEPPSFQQAEKLRMGKVSSEEQAKEGTDNDMLCENITGANENGKAVSSSATIGSVFDNGASSLKQSEGVASADQSVDEAAFEQSTQSPDINNTEKDESDSFSDIDDLEVDGYLHNEEEKHYKKIIWEEMNKEYLEEQAAKEAAAAAAREAYEATFKDCSEDVLAAKELAAAAAAAVAKSKKEKKQKRAEEAKNAPPPQTAAEATRKMLDKKKICSKINYDVLQSLFEEPEVQKGKKARFESDIHVDDHQQNSKQSERLMDSGSVENVQNGPDYGLGEVEDGVGYDEYSYYGNDDEYGYDEVY